MNYLLLTKEREMKKYNKIKNNFQESEIIILHIIKKEMKKEKKKNHLLEKDPL